MAKRIVVAGIQANTPFIEADYAVWDGSTFLANSAINYSPASDTTDDTVIANIISGVIADAATTLGYTVLPANVMGPVISAQTATQVQALITAALPVAPASYQTIVSQTGTGAPAVSGSFAPASTYPAGTTFTWARTGAGVYTLTASTAVFNTSGKTGVFVGTLNNLNASCKAVVTSSTVITVTTAVQSVAILGLLGLTATNTDALLTQTMLYVQTYA